MKLFSNLFQFFSPSFVRRGAGRGRIRKNIFVFFLIFLTVSQSLLSQSLEEARIVEKLGATVDLNSTTFKDEEGKNVILSQYFQKEKPVVLMLVYFQCPSLCNFVLNGFNQAAKKLKLTISDNYEVVTVSINPKEGPNLAKQKKAAYVREYGRLSGEKGWHFLTGTEEQIKKLAAQVGFGYVYDPKIKEYAHGPGIFVLTPEGKISRVLHGIEYPDLKLSLLEASQGKIGTLLDRVLLYCYRYNPNAKGYSLYALNIVKCGGFITLLILSVTLFVFWRKERKKMSPMHLDEEKDRKKTLI